MRHTTNISCVVTTTLTAVLLLSGCGGSDDAKTPPAASQSMSAKTAPGSKDADNGTKKPTSTPKARNVLQLTEAEQKDAGIVLGTVQPQKIAQPLLLTANIAANQDRLARLGPRVEGRIIRIQANLGERVKAGQALATIDSVQVGEARAEYRRTQSELRLAEAAFRRSDELHREEVVSQKQWLEAKAAYQSAQASARSATEKLRLLTGSANAGESSFVLTSPFAGTVIEKKAVLGELTRPDAPLFTVADLSTVWVEADVGEQDLGKLRVGARASTTVASYPGEVFQGKVTYLSSVFDRQTRTLKARVEIPNLDGRLKLDMFAKVAIDRDATREVLLLPQEAVVLLQGQAFVYVPENNHFDLHMVELGEQLNGKTEISSGLKAGDQVVTRGAYALKARQLKSQLGDND